MVALSRYAARSAHQEIHAAELARTCRKSSQTGDGRMVRVKLHVAGNEQIQQAIVIVVTPRRAGGPSTQRDAGFLCHILERAILIVVIKAVLSEIRNVDVRPAVIVVVAHRDSETPTLIRDDSFVRNVCERSVMIVMEQHCARGCFLSLQSSKRRTVEQVNV